MKINRKWAAGIGVALSVGLALWARELASWRPITVAKVDFRPGQLHFSRDGKKILVNDDFGDNAKVLNLETGRLNSVPKRDGRFFEEDEWKKFPRVWMNERTSRFTFSASPSQNIQLKNMVAASGYGAENGPKPDLIFGEVEMFGLNGEDSRFGWSKARGEVYGEIKGEIWIWDWKDGHLKKRVRYAKTAPTRAMFSPDGKWLLTFGGGYPDVYGLHRNDVQSGKATVINRGVENRFLGFSPDGQFLWFVSENVGYPFTFNVYSASNSQFLWTAECAGPGHWLPDGRIGMIQKDGFEWRDAMGRQLKRLPGPFPVRTSQGALTYMQDWVLSPDGNWIYSCEIDGTIRRWRAR